MIWIPGRNTSSVVGHPKKKKKKKKKFPPFRVQSQVANLSVCGHLFLGWEEEIMEQTSISFSEVTLNLALGTCHKNLLQAVQSKGQSRTCGHCLIVRPVFTFDHSSSSVRGREM